MGDLKRKVLNLMNGAGRASASNPSAEQERRDDRELPMIGSVLRAARVQAGLELRDVATMLKIRHVFMQAIEDGRYQELPGTAYAVGFVRAYADYLGLDGDAVVRRFKDEMAGKVGHQNLYFPTPVPEGRVPGGTILLFSVILICLVYGGWYVLSATDRSMVDVVPALPQRLVSLLEVFTHGNSGSGNATPPAASAPAGSAKTGAADAGSGASPAPATAPATAAPALPPAESGTGAGSEPAPILPGGVVLKPATPPEVHPGVSLGSLPPPGPSGTPAGPEAAGGEAGDEIPLVSGPADETVGEPGPLVPMTPRTKPAPPGGAAPADATPLPAGANATPATVPAPQTTTAPGPAPAGAPPAAPPAAGAAIPPPPAAEAALPTGRVYGGQNHESRLQIRAVQDVWVQVRDASGDPVFTRMLHTGDAYRVPDHPGMRLRTGNAGGLVAIVDGGEPQPLGQAGQVLHDVPIAADHLPRADDDGN